MCMSFINKIFFLTAVLLIQKSAFAFCFKEAGQKYGIDPNLLKAIAQVESSMRPRIESPTNDIGLMGINRSWLPILNKRFGMTEAQVWDPCGNVMVGAWILAHNFKQFGSNWNAIGAYNAACTRLAGVSCARVRQNYSMKVYQAWM